MSARSALLAAFALVPLWAGAQATARIEFDKPHHFITFSSEQVPKATPKGQEHEGARAEVALPAAGSLYVWDRDSGNLARRPASQVGKQWRLTTRDLELIGLVIVRVEHQGEPVASARVVLKDKSGARSQLLDRSAEGEAQFFAVQPGKVSVTVEYRSGGTDAPPVEQVFTVPLTRTSPDPLLKISLPEPAETVGAGTPASPPTPAPTKPPAARRSFLGSLLMYLIGLGAAGGLGYYAYRMAVQNPKWVQDRLSKFGVSTQDAQPAADPVGASDPLPDPEPIVPPAPTKILLNDATPIATSVASTEPRLVTPTGESLSLPEGESVVGREAGLGVSLAGEASVSRRHAALVRQGSSLLVRDLGSTNGTFVNGRRIDADTPLRSGDDVQFGAVRFRVEGV